MSPSRTSRPQMVFLIGAARSGTKFLRDLLAESEAAVCVPFDVNYVWRYRNESLPDDFIPPESADHEIADFIGRTLTRMAQKAAGESRPIVIEKTVSNVFRVPFIYRLFPDARFVHLIRDGRDVTLSAARQWESPSDVGYLFDKLRYFPVRNWAYAIWYIRNALQSRFRKKAVVPVWGPRYPGVDRDVGNLTVLEIAAMQWSKSLLAAREGLAVVPEDQRFSIHYEDLVANPLHLSDLVRFLELPDPARIAERYENTVSRDTGGAWGKLRLDLRSDLMKILEPGLLAGGYISGA